MKIGLQLLKGVSIQKSLWHAEKHKKKNPTKITTDLFLFVFVCACVCVSVPTTGGEKMPVCMAEGDCDSFSLRASFS